MLGVRVLAVVVEPRAHHADLVRRPQHALGGRGGEAFFVRRGGEEERGRRRRRRRREGGEANLGPDLPPIGVVLSQVAGYGKGVLVNGYGFLVQPVTLESHVP